MPHTKPLLAPFYIIAATFIGIADTLFLSYYHFLNQTPGCAIGGCEIVLHHWLAAPYGISLAYLGLVYYAYMFGLAVLVAWEPRSKALITALLGYTAVGLLCSITFELLQVFVIGAMCLYCGISAATTAVLFALSIWHYISVKKRKVLMTVGESA